MRFSTLAFALLPLLAVAEETTTLTSTATMTRTITVSEVIASVTSTYGTNSTATYPTSVRSASFSPTAASTTIPANFMGAAPSLNGMYAGSAGVLVMIAAALL